MTGWFDLDLPEMFSFHRPPLDFFLRGTLVYLALCILLRILPKRHTGRLSPNDLLVLILIGGTASTALELAPMSVPDVLIVAGTIMFWSLALDWLGFHFPRLRPWLGESPTRLIEDGRLLWKNMRKELVTEDELLAQLRAEGVHDVRLVREACLEANGDITVIPRGEGDTPPASDGRREPSAEAPRERAGGCSPRFPLNGQNMDGHEDQDEESAVIEDEDSAVVEFFRAAERLQDRLRQHQEAARQIKAALTQHGVRLKAPAQPSHSDEANATTAQEEISRNGPEH